MTNPKQTVRWPGVRTAITQLSQMKVAGISAAPFSANTRTQTTQGVPRLVTSVATNKTVLSPTSCRVSVSFVHNAGDPYFTGAKVYLKLGNGVPSPVAEGHSSPLTFVTARTVVPANVIVISQGNWGSTAIAESPGNA